MSDPLTRAETHAILPCPFCGSAGDELHVTNGIVHCDHCEASGPYPMLTMDDVSRTKDGIRAWNERAVPGDVPRRRAVGPNGEELFAYGDVRLAEGWRFVD